MAVSEPSSPALHLRLDGANQWRHNRDRVYLNIASWASAINLDSGGQSPGDRGMTKNNSEVTPLTSLAQLKPEKSRKSSLQVLLPKSLHALNTSLESLPLHSPLSPLSPSGDFHLEEIGSPRQPDTPNTPKLDTGKGSSGDASVTKLNKRESYKAQRKNYRREKKRVANELLSTLKDPSIIVLADWLKVRGTLKGWTKLWCVLKPGLLLLYKSPKTHKSGHWVGTVLLNTCELIERPSKKDGFCFKLFHPMEQSIWATRGPSGEAIGAMMQPLPTAYLIFRAPSEAAGKCWMDALELALRCTSLLMRSMTNKGSAQGGCTPVGSPVSHANILSSSPQLGMEQIAAFLDNHQENVWNESDYERHFRDHDVDYGGLTDDSATSSHSVTPDPSPRPSLTTPQGDVPCPSPTPFYHRLALALSTNTSEGQQHQRHCRHHSSSSPLMGLKALASLISSSQDLPDPACSTPHSSPTTPYEVDGVSLATHEDAESEHLPLISLQIPQLITPLSPHPTPDLEDDAHTDDNREADQDGVQSLRSSDTDSEGHEKEDEKDFDDMQPVETPYAECGKEEFGLVGDAGQTEEVAEENKSLIWSLVKQVRPGMDLSKVVLPTFILEPRSFLDKLSDYYYHSDIVSKVVPEDDPFTRIKYVVQWYLSGFYKKPKGLKKPYNPILGETFRCYWLHPETDSRTFYIAEQVSHHPPVSAFYVTNRKDGFCVSGSILAKSKFYGNSLSAILDGKARLTLLTRGEDYMITMPYAHCKGILMGTLTMELGGKILIECEKTGYRAELEFKLKPFLGGTETANVITGKIKLGKETLALVDGHWDQEIFVIDKRTGEKQLLWNPTPDIRNKRLRRFTVPIEHQGEFESERLWQHVSAAICRGDQIAATEEKTILEEAQRQQAKERKVKCAEWLPHFFEQDLITGEWVYKHADLRPWDPRNDVLQYECDFVIRTKTRHRTPIIRTSSIVSVDDQVSVDRVLSRNQRLTKQASLGIRIRGHESGSSTPEAEALHPSDSSDSEVTCKKVSNQVGEDIVHRLLKRLEDMQHQQGERVIQLQRHVEHIIKEQRQVHLGAVRHDWLLIVVVIVFQALLHWLFKT